MFLDKEEEVVYYDPCESPEELGALDGVPGLPGDRAVQVSELSRRYQRLESQRGGLCARRARLRNRQVGGLPALFPSPARTTPMENKVLKILVSFNTNIERQAFYQYGD